MNAVSWQYNISAWSVFENVWFGVPREERERERGREFENMGRAWFREGVFPWRARASRRNRSMPSPWRQTFSYPRSRRCSSRRPTSTQSCRLKLAPLTQCSLQNVYRVQRPRASFRRPLKAPKYEHLTSKASFLDFALCFMPSPTNISLKPPHLPFYYSKIIFQLGILTLISNLFETCLSIVFYLFKLLTFVASIYFFFFVVCNLFYNKLFNFYYNCSNFYYNYCYNFKDLNSTLYNQILFI